ncbi:MAG: hypothetical protein H7Z72_16625 [Bacteroidetes bacterium]|nr:hypothetical protein [Fibrella sp.]
MEPIERIDLYLDKQLSAEQAAQLERDLDRDPSLRTLLTSVRLARDAVKTAALRDRVNALHHQFIQDLPPLETTDEGSVENPVPVMPLRPARSVGWLVGVAASVVLALLGYGLYQYTVLNATGFYAAKYVQYQLPVTRGTTTGPTPLDQLYAAADFPEVPRQFARLSVRTPKDYFLTALAHLHQSQFDPAIDRFTDLRQLNRQQNRDAYEQETDYYLALAYLGAGRVSDAYPLFEKINQTPRHLYHRTITDWDLWRLNILTYKE